MWHKHNDSKLGNTLQDVERTKLEVLQLVCSAKNNHMKLTERQQVINGIV